MRIVTSSIDMIFISTCIIDDLPRDIKRKPENFRSLFSRSTAKNRVLRPLSRLFPNHGLSHSFDHTFAPEKHRRGRGKDCKDPPRRYGKEAPHYFGTGGPGVPVLWACWHTVQRPWHPMIR